jgi:hypothetical protein
MSKEREDNSKQVYSKPRLMEQNKSQKSLFKEHLNLGRRDISGAKTGRGLEGSQSIERGA